MKTPEAESWGTWIGILLIISYFVHLTITGNNSYTPYYWVISIFYSIFMTNAFFRLVHKSAIDDYLEEQKRNSKP